MQSQTYGLIQFDKGTTEAWIIRTISKTYLVRNPLTSSIRRVECHLNNFECGATG